MEFKEIYENVKKKSPLVHCLTNYVTVADVAHIIAASGASPIMADSYDEMEDMASIAASLNINIGTINKDKLKAMLKARDVAYENKAPIVLDLVGIAASDFRRKSCLKLIEGSKIALVKGNISEVLNLYNNTDSARGVDLDPSHAIKSENIKSYVKMAKDLSKRIDSTVLITGAKDIVADKDQAYVIDNGHPFMAELTGTGCMLSGLAASFIGANPDNILKASALATALMGIAGEIAYDRLKDGEGPMAFRTYLIDSIFNLSYEDIKERISYDLI